MKRWICRLFGHGWHTDPGDVVLYCRRCHFMSDPHDWWAEP